MNESTEKKWTEPTAPAVSREALIDALSERFYMNEQGKLVSNGFSTEFMYFPSDLDPKHASYKNRRINDGLDYDTAFSDVAELNALLELPPREPKFYETLGLYLYMADEFSRLHPKTTFLTELRKANIMVKDEQNYNRPDLYAKITHMLDSLGMTESHGKIFEDWYKNGHYTIKGHEEETGPNAYTRLARDISSMRKNLPLTLVISYAIGNKNHIRSMTAEEAYNYTNSLTGPEEASKVNPEIKNCIEKGRRVRKMRIRDMLEDIYKKEYGGVTPPRNEECASIASTIFSALPTNALELFYREGYNCAYADDVNIKQCYPAEPIPGALQGHEDSYLSKGLRNKRYRVLFLSNGVQQNPDNKTLNLTQTLMHEIMHIAISYLDDNQRQLLWEKAEAAHHELQEFHAWQEEMDVQDSAAWLKVYPMPSYFRDRLKSISYLPLTRVLSLDTALDYQSFPYQGYRGDAKLEEVVCNLAGLMYSEFPYGAKQGSNPYQELKALGLPALDALAQQINASLAIACAESRKKFPYIDLPQSAVIRGQ